MQLDTFHKEEIFPKMPSILTTSKWAKVINDGIAQTDVAKINFLALLNLVIKIFSKRIASFDNEAFFQNVDVTFNRLTMHSDLSTETFVGNLLADSIGKQFEQLSEGAGATNIL